MESYNDFLNRISSFEKPETYYGAFYFNPNNSLWQKVNEFGAFKPFFGDTVVFDLDDKAKQKLSDTANYIHSVAPECFCEKLIPETFHMTLHDLSNSSDINTVAKDVFTNELEALKKMREIEDCEIRMKTKFVFNMVSTSLVLGLYPADENEYSKLMELYHRFDCIKQLSYPLTPHITLAYYNPHGFDTPSARKLEEAIKKLNRNAFDITLSTKNLYYQKFTSMNNYVNIFSPNSVKFL